MKLYFGGSRNIPSGDYEIFKGYVYQPKFYVNFSTLTSLEHIIGGENEKIFFFNVNVYETSMIYDYFNDYNYLTFGPSSDTTESTDPTFSVIFKNHLCLMLFYGFLGY